jgi:hypothetical protein
MDDKSVIFRYISGKEFTEEELNKICLSYEEDIKSSAIAKETIRIENKKREERRNHEKRKQCFYNDILEQIENSLMEAKEKLYDTKARRIEANIQVKFN